MSAYDDFLARLRSQLKFPEGGRPTNFQLHHIIPKEILNPLLEPDNRYTDAQKQAAKLVAIALKDRAWQSHKPAPAKAGVEAVQRAGARAARPAELARVRTLAALRTCHNFAIGLSPPSNLPAKACRNLRE
jgi:hypothetical protein